MTGVQPAVPRSDTHNGGVLSTSLARPHTRSPQLMGHTVSLVAPKADKVTLRQEVERSAAGKADREFVEDIMKVSGALRACSRCVEDMVLATACDVLHAAVMGKAV